jgi:hypothetical protein
MVDYFQSLIESGKSTYEVVNKVSKRVGSNQYSLEHKVVVSKKHDVAVIVLDKLQKGLGLARMIMLSPNIVEENNVDAQAYIWVERYPFCRLGFEPFMGRTNSFLETCVSCLVCACSFFIIF